MTVPLPPLHKPEAIAAVLGCSSWWVKERARRREIPFVLVGKAYRFTEDHLAEIIGIFEQRPDQGQGRNTASTGRRRQPQQPTETVVRLQARPPRRKTG